MPSIKVPSSIDSSTAGAVSKDSTAGKENLQSVSESVPPQTKPKKKICCACPDTKKTRDECIVLNGEEACQQFIEAHKLCLRSEGFNV